MTEKLDKIDRREKKRQKAYFDKHPEKSPYVCTKIGFPTKEIADKALVKVKASYQMAFGYKGTKTFETKHKKHYDANLNSYFCRSCKVWHHGHDRYLKQN